MLSHVTFAKSMFSGALADGTPADEDHGNTSFPHDEDATQKFSTRLRKKSR